MKDCIPIGPAPSDEECVPLMKDDPGYAHKARAECRRFIEAIRKKLGEPPDGAELVVKGFDHDFGRYCEVCVVFDAENEQAMEYAYLVEARAPKTWDDVAPLDRAKLLARCERCERRNYECECKREPGPPRCPKCGASLHTLLFMGKTPDGFVCKGCKTWLSEELKPLATVIT